MGFSFLLCFVVNLILGDRRDPMIVMQMQENTCTQKCLYYSKTMCKSEWKSSTLGSLPYNIVLSIFVFMFDEGLKTTFSNIFGFWFYTEVNNFEYVWVGEGGLSDNDVSVV